MSFRQFNSMVLRTEPGWTGAFTRLSVKNALPNGTRVVKQSSEAGDGHPDGTPGVVLGSLPVDPADHPSARILYFVEWAPRPRVAVATADFKLREAQ